MPDNKRAVIYARVSTDEQKLNYSLSTQVQACEKHAREQGFDIVAIFKDDYSGATPIETRPEGRKAYDLLRSSQADVLIAYRIDRIVRPPEDGDEWDMPLLIRGLAKLNKAIHTLDRGQLKTDFASLLIAMLDAKSAGEERRKIIERTTRGRNAKAGNGKVVGNGKALYGYKYTYSLGPNGKPIISGLEVVKHEAEIVREIYQWYIGGGGYFPMGSHTIAQRLTEQSVPTPDKRKSMPGRNTEGIWNISQVRKMLSNETYAGKWRYGKRIGKYGGNGKRRLDDQITVDVPPIIDRAVWTAAQSQRDYNIKVSRRHNTSNQYLLRGMIKCGCGYSYTGYTPTGRDYFVYRCGRNMNIVGRRERCLEKRVRGQLLETLAWNYLISVVTDRNQLMGRLRDAQASMLLAATPLQTKRTEINEMIAEAEAEAEMIATAMKSAQGIVEQALKRQAEELNRRYTELIKRRDKIDAEIEAAVISDQSITDIMQFSEVTIEGLNNPTWEEKRRWLEYLRVSVVIQDRKATISCMLPVAPEVFDLNTF